MSFDDTGGFAVGAVALALVLWWVIRLIRETRRIGEGQPDARALDRRDRSIGTLGRCTGLLGILAISFVASTNQGLQTWLIAMLGVIVAGVLVGLERWWPRPSGVVRSAVVVRRSAPDMLTRAGVGLTVLVVIVLLALTPWVISQRARRHSGASAGWTTCALTIVGLLLICAIAAVGIRAARDRPSVSGVNRQLDNDFRRAAADRLVRLVGIVASICALDMVDWAGSGQVSQDSGQASGGAPGWMSAGLIVLAIAVLEVGRARPNVRPATGGRAHSSSASSPSPTAPTAPSASSPSPSTASTS